MRSEVRPRLMEPCYGNQADATEIADKGSPEFLIKASDATVRTLESVTLLLCTRNS